MNCMKCGKKTEGSNVFCAECLAEMEKYPVKPGTVVHIPVRSPEPEKKQPRRKKEASVEEQLANTRSLVRNMAATILALVTALIVTGSVLLYTLFQPQPEIQTPTGRNYSTSASTTD